MTAERVRQLAEYVSVFEGDDDERRLRRAVEQTARSLDVEVAAVVSDNIVRCSWGPIDGEIAGSPPGSREIDHSSLGALFVSCVVIDRRMGNHRLVVARRSTCLDDVELTLLASMARTLGLALDLHEARSIERQLHDDLTERSRINSRLAASLDQRDRLLDRLFRIQRSITERDPITGVLDSIVVAAVGLIGESLVGLRIVNSVSDTATLVAAAGPDGVLHRSTETVGVDQGLGGRSITENRFIVWDDYQTAPDALANWCDVGVTTAMSAPVRRNGAAVACLTAFSTKSGHRYSEDDHQVLRALAEHGSLALNDASAIEVIQRSLERAVFDSQHDQLTGLANRSKAIERLTEWASADSGTSVIFVDLDRFKTINDAYGHSTGDEILRQVARRLSDVVRVDDVVARLAGDEFLVLARSDDEATVADLAGRIADHLTFVAIVDRREIPVSASVGCARHLVGESPDDVIANADVAMFRAKESGGARLVQFDRNMRDERLAQLKLERELRFAAEHDEFIVFFQPVIELATLRLVGAEALVRWQHPRRGLLQPGAFIDAAEDAGLLGEIDSAALHQAVGQLASWQRSGDVDDAFRIGVNVSARQFGDQRLVSMVAEELDDAGLDPSRLWLEITETTMMRDVAQSSATMHELKALGAHLSVDDFGTGWSSLAYLKQFPVEALKIDQSFIAGLCRNADDRAIVEATIGLAKALGLGVIAEGVETPEQANELLAMGCPSVQGYLYSRPLPADEFARRWLHPSVDRAVGGGLSSGTTPHALLAQRP